MVVFNILLSIHKVIFTTEKCVHMTVDIWDGHPITGTNERVPVTNFCSLSPLTTFGMHTYPRKNERLRHYVRSYDIRIVHIAAWKISDFGIVSNYVREYVRTYTCLVHICHNKLYTCLVQLAKVSHNRTQLLS